VFCLLIKPSSNEMKKTVLTYGLLGGLIIVLLGAITRPLFINADGKFDMTTGELVGYVNMILSLSMVFFGIRQYRDKHLGGTITFKKALWVGFLIALIASLMYVAGWMIYFNTSEVAQTFPQQYLDYMKTSWAEAGKSAEEITKLTDQYLRNMEMYKNPFFMAAITLMEILPVGFLIALISAFILRKK
jgi:hypothetical protein